MRLLDCRPSKILTAFAALVLSTSSVVLAAEFDADCPFENSLRQQVAKLDCSFRGLAQHINEGNEIVPKTLYHYGKEEFLRHHAEKKTIAQDRWDKFIMGGETRFPLEPNRRGLYGTAGVDTNSFGTGEHNWLMEIHVKDECRDPKNVVTFFNMASSERFKKWFAKLPAAKRAFSSEEEFGKVCFSSGKPKTNHTGDFSEANSKCGTFINAYLVQSKVKVVQDHAIRKSFYLRDRSCIEDIKATPKDLIELAAKRELLWLAPCEEAKSRGVGSLVTTVNRALARHEAPVPDAALDKITENHKLAKMPTDALEAYRRCRDSNNLAEYRDRIQKADANGYGQNYAMKARSSYAKFYGPTCNPSYVPPPAPEN
jgi:hypothetical protein